MVCGKKSSTVRVIADPSQLDDEDTPASPQKSRSKLFRAMSKLIPRRKKVDPMYKRGRLPPDTKGFILDPKVGLPTLK